MDPKKYFKDAGEIVLLNELTMRKIADDRDALYDGFLILTISGFLGAIGYYFFLILELWFIALIFPVIKNTIETTVISLVTFYAVGYLYRNF